MEEIRKSDLLALGNLLGSQVRGLLLRKWSDQTQPWRVAVVVKLYTRVL